MNIINKIIKNPMDSTYNPAWHINSDKLANLCIYFAIIALAYISFEVEPTLLGNLSMAFTYTYIFMKMIEIGTRKPYTNHPTVFYFGNIFGLLLLASLVESFTSLPFIFALIALSAGLLYFYGQRIEKEKAKATQKDETSNNDGEDV